MSEWRDWIDPEAGSIDYRFTGLETAGIPASSDDAIAQRLAESDKRLQEKLDAKS